MALHQQLQTAATTGNGVLKAFSGEVRELKIYIIGSSGVSAGAVQFEEAATPGYTGTWSAIGSPVTVVASTTLTVAITGAFLAVRARISTNIVGGTVTVDLVGNEYDSDVAGSGTFAVGDLIVATGLTRFGSVADTAVGKVLVSGGVGAVPVFSATPTVTGLTTASLTFNSSGTVTLTNPSNGALTVGGDLTATNSLQTGAAGLIYWAGRSILTSPATGQLNATNYAGTAGVGLDFATDAVLKVRTRAQSAYASLMSSNHYVDDGNASFPGYSFTSEPSLGFWRSGAGNVALVGGALLVPNMQVSAGGQFYWSGRAVLDSPANGNVRVMLYDASIGIRLKADALPTVASGFGASPSITAGSTPLAGSVNVGTGGSATSGVINFNGTAFPSAPFVVVTSSLTNAVIRATASTTQLTITCTTAFTASDVISWVVISSK